MSWQPLYMGLSGSCPQQEAKLSCDSPKDVFAWTSGKALIATGSPFPPIDRKDGGDQYVVAECNNVSCSYILHFSPM